MSSEHCFSCFTQNLDDKNDLDDMDIPVNISPSTHWSSFVLHKDETMMEKVKTSVKFQSKLRCCI